MPEWLKAVLTAVAVLIVCYVMYRIVFGLDEH